MNKKIKHSKVRNTGLIVELLLVAAAKEGGKNTKAAKILKEHFKPGSELVKDLKMYQMLTSYEYRNKGEDFIRKVIKEIISKDNVNTEKLKTELYNLIKSITENYDQKEFFSNQVADYKALASTNQMLEIERYGKDDITNIPKRLIFEDYIVDYLAKFKSIETKINESTRTLTKAEMNTLFKNFEKKYSELLPEQKKVLEILLISESLAPIYGELKKASSKLAIILTKETVKSNEAINVKVEACKAKLDEMLEKRIQDKEKLTDVILRTYSLIDILQIL